MTDDDEDIIPTAPISLYEVVKPKKSKNWIPPREFMLLIKPLVAKLKFAKREKIDGKLYFYASLEDLETKLLEYVPKNCLKKNLSKLMKQLVECGAVEIKKQNNHDFYFFSKNILLEMHESINRTYEYIIESFENILKKYLLYASKLSTYDIMFLREKADRFYAKTGDWNKVVKIFDDYIREIIIFCMSIMDEYLNLGNNFFFNTNWDRKLIRRIDELIDMFEYETGSLEGAFERLEQYMKEIKNTPWIIEWLIESKLSLEWLLKPNTVDKIFRGDYKDYRYENVCEYAS